MDRRDFLKSAAAIAAVPGMALASDAPKNLLHEQPRGPESRAAWAELMATLAEAESRYLGPEWNITRAGDIADGHRFLLHVLNQGLDMWLEASPERPTFTRIVSPSKKSLGDNPDAIYFSAPILPNRSYRVRGNLAGATYTSLTLEGGNRDGRYPKRVAGALNDTEFGVRADGNYEIILSPRRHEGPWLRLDPDVGTLTTRHYFESNLSVAANPDLRIPLEIENIDELPPPRTPNDESIAAGIRRVRNFVHGLTLREKPRTPDQQPAWVSLVPNIFKRPQKWFSKDGGFGAVDNAYAMAPYVVMPDQALVIEGRFPPCRFANVVLWNRFLQTYDYVHRQISLNRKQIQLEADGRFKLVVAHADPGSPNWLDTEGRVTGIVYWRFLLPEGEIEPLQAKILPLAEVREG